MSLELTTELREALANSNGQPLQLEDPQTRNQYVIVPLHEFEKLQQGIEYDASELTDEEMLAAAQQGLDDPEGWGAPGMEEYDEYGKDSSS